MFLIKLIFSRIGPHLGLFLVRILPKKWAYRVGEWIVKLLLSNQHSDLYMGVRANQAVVRNLPYEHEKLHEAVREVLLNSANGFVDWFRTMAFSEDLESLPCSIDAHIIEEGYRLQKEGYGLIYVGAHLSSFNMFFMKLAQSKFPVQILSYAQVKGSYKTDNLFRKRFGLNVTPIAPQSLRQAFKRLQGGGFVLTGVDRPDTGGEKLKFFGRTTTLPIGHARLALRTGARLLIGAVKKVNPGQYHVTGSQVIVPSISGDSKSDAIRLTQQILEHLEELIKERPSEWMMFLPLWPEVLPERS